jgi:hypothetical protein
LAHPQHKGQWWRLIKSHNLSSHSHCQLPFTFTLFVHCISPLHFLNVPIRPPTNTQYAFPPCSSNSFQYHCTAICQQQIHKIQPIYLGLWFPPFLD